MSTLESEDATLFIFLAECMHGDTTIRSKMVLMAFFFGPQLQPAQIMSPSIHARRIHPLINPSIHPSYLVKPEVARINPVTIMHNCVLLLQMNILHQDKTGHGFNLYLRWSNDQQQHFCPGKKRMDATVAPPISGGRTCGGLLGVHRIHDCEDRAGST